MAHIIFNGVSSNDLGLRIINNLESSSTGQDINTISVPGRDGDLLVSNNRLKSVYKSFPLQLNSKTNLTKSQEDISHWLNVPGYHDLELSWDPNYLYRAAFIETFDIKEILRKLGKLKINFLCFPIKFIKSSLIEKTISSGTIIYNLGNVYAHPIIKIIGTGDIVLSINGRNTYIKDLQGTLVIDRQKKSVFFGNLYGWDFIERRADSQWPYLDVGNNTISLTGNVTECSITPFMGVKL